MSEVGNRSVAIHQKDICRDVDIAPWSTEGVGQDPAIIQDDELGIDRNVAAASYPALNARRDLLSVRCTSDPVVVIVILPPSAGVASVVTLPFCMFRSLVIDSYIARQ